MIKIPSNQSTGAAQNPDPVGSIRLRAGAGSISVTPDQVRAISKKFGKIAHNMGETNDEDGYSEEMEATILAALKRVKKRQQP